jgi:DNA-binding PadR family transcriptional regulator
MSKPSPLGQFEQLVLAAILALGDDAYGVTIHSRAEELMQPRGCKLGAIYVTLDRMEEKGLIVSQLSEPTAQRGGRKRRLYRLSPSGEEALGDAAVVARRVITVIEQHWGDRKWSTA